jgi:hypothetical protein
MQLSVFKKVTLKMPFDIELDEIVAEMKTGEGLRLRCEHINILVKKGKIKEAKELKKKSLPAFAPAAFLFDGKARGNVTGLTDLCFLDIDHITDEEIEEAMTLLRNDPHVVLAVRSTSVHGLHILVRYKLDGVEHPWIGNMGTNRMNHTYGSVFKTMRHHYQDILQLTIDKLCSNMERLCFYSYDPYLYYNPDVTNNSYILARTACYPLSLNPLLHNTVRQ